MVNLFLSNCISYLQRLRPEMIAAALVMAIVVTIAARLLLVPLALLVNKAPRWFSLLVDILFVAGAILVSAPIVYVLTAAGLRRVNRETVLAAQTLGMKGGVIRRKVILPQARGWIRAGLILCFLRAFLDSVVVQMVYFFMILR